MDYSVHTLARMEHEQMIRSLASVAEYGNPMAADQSRWASKQVGRLLHAVGSGLASIGERMEHGRDLTFEVPPTGKQESGVPG